MSLKDSIIFVVLGALTGFGVSWIRGLIEEYRRGRYDSEIKGINEDIREGEGRIKDAKERFEKSVSDFNDAKNHHNKGRKL